MRVLGYIKCQALPELFKLIKYLSNSGSKNALFELFLARAKNELNMASSRFSLPQGSTNWSESVRDIQNIVTDGPVRSKV